MKIKIPIPRCTVRRLIVLVAAVAFGFGTAQGLTRWIDARRAEFVRMSLQHEIEKAAWLRLPTSTESRAKIAYYSQLSIKYHLAVESPWLPVDSDPPEPN